MVKKSVIQISTFLFILVLSLSSVKNPITSSYLHDLTDEATMTMQAEDPLYQEILEYRDDYEEDPIDARVDKVWKAVPGYNGLQVDVTSSFEQMKEEGQFDERRLVYDQISPEVSLEDLPPSAIYRGNENKPMVTLMVNVAWGNEELPELLKVMNEQEIRSTFFLDGSWVKNHPKLAKMIVEEGHEIGNHAYSHPDMRHLSSGQIAEELDKTNEVIEATLDVTPDWFAPPSGSYRDEVVKLAADRNMGTMMWSVDTIDWRNPAPEQMTRKVLDNVHNGATVLMHPTQSTARALEDIIDGIKDQGYRIGTVSELMDEKRLPVTRDTDEK
ncbi:polysaccharide deacetylase family protein [Texcoconibacillus texcoconensis]|uniref:Putative sporulation protein (Polysaccharide deacetylase family) n=1 Tax=Texcoconibacillus texcoconensis TaxID=1095777 RepID=A0A840QKP8_9BACI|nr:polysaccharide deacetylase family protein [Texcoconibacillus texcoconensis]MBB5172027.1 putative sporulation protein (polysaccharide deacetylase family) [Texcoconibacillus texcoconensis]